MGNRVTKKILIGLALLGTSISAYSAEAEKKACFAVEGMTCTSCSLTLKAAVKKLDGIKSVTASVENGSAEVIFDSAQTNKNQIASKINSTGYKSTIRACRTKS